MTLVLSLALSVSGSLMLTLFAMHVTRTESRHAQYFWAVTLCTGVALVLAAFLFIGSKP